MADDYTRGASDLTTFTTDWKRLQSQKSRMFGGVEARILLNLGMYFGEHYLKHERETIRTRLDRKENSDNSLNLVFSLLGKQLRQRIGRFSSISPEARATPDKVDPKAYDQAEVVTKLTRALQKKCRESHLMWLRYFWLLIAGVVVEHTPWSLEASREPMAEFDESGQPMWTDQATHEDLTNDQVLQMVQRGLAPERFVVKESLQMVGEVGSEIISPLNWFIDASVPSIHKLSPDQACYIAEIKSEGWILENFGQEYEEKLKHASDDLTIVKTKMLSEGLTTGNVNLKDMIPAIQGTRGPDDPPMHIVLTRYQPPHKQFPHGRRTILIPDGCVLDDDDLMYEDIPCVDFHWEPNATTFWSKDYLSDLIPAQKFLNKRVSQLGEAANATVNEVLLLGGELSKADIPTDLHGVVEDGLSEDGMPRVMALQRSQLPPFFLESIKFVVEFIESIGGANLLQHKKFPGQLRGSLSAPILQEILDSEDGSFFLHLGEQLERVYQMRVNRVKAFYEPIRTLHYTDTDQKDEVLVFHKSEVLTAGTEFHISIDRSSLIPEFSALREARITERLSGPLAILYADKRTGKLDPSKIAQDLKYGDRARESREAQYRKLEGQIIAKLWKGEVIDPALPLPFWDHNACMDELEAVMATWEWIEASPQIRQAFITMHERHRQYLAAIQESQAQAVQSQMMQGAVAQATQQAAAKAASLAAEAAIEQVLAQAQLTHPANAGNTSRDLQRRGAMGGQKPLPTRAAVQRRPIEAGTMAPEPPHTM